MDLVLQSEVEGQVLHFLLNEDFSAWVVLLLLEVFDHVREPHGQAIVAKKENGELINETLWYNLKIQVTTSNLKQSSSNS